jgi:hypothetical protein
MFNQLGGLIFRQAFGLLKGGIQLRMTPEVVNTGRWLNW